MTISYDYIPGALRYPGSYIEIDASAAGLSGDIGTVLIVGQKLASGSAPAGEITLVSGVHDARVKAGAGSMLAKMVERYRAIDPSLDVYMLPYSDNAAGVQATGTLAVTGVADAAGAMALYVGGELVSVPVLSGQTAQDVATAMAAAVNASVLGLPVTATAAADVVTLTARHKGTCGNGIDVRLSLYGEDAVSGIVVSITGMAGGAGDPAPGDLSALLGNRYWFNYVALGMNDAATLAAWHAESQVRYQPPIQQGFRIFTAFRGDYAAAVSFGMSMNAEHVACLALGINPVSHWEAAAIVAAAAAPKLRNSPVESLEGRALSGLIGVNYFDWTQANSLLFKGMSVLQMTRDGSCSVKRLVSMYQYRPDGSADDAYLDINTVEVLERIRYEQRVGAVQRFTGTAIAKSNEGYRPGLRITTEDSVRAYLLSLYENVLMRERGWVQAYDYYKSTLVVELDPTNPSRFNFSDKPVVLSPYYVLAGRAKFMKAIPQA